MKKVTPDEFKDDFDGLCARARMETVAITNAAGEPDVVMLSWEVFSQLRKGTRRALKIAELSEEEKRSLLNAKMSEEFNYLDEELEE